MDREFEHPPGERSRFSEGSSGMGMVLGLLAAVVLAIVFYFAFANRSIGPSSPVLTGTERPPPQTTTPPGKTTTTPTKPITAAPAPSTK